MDPMPALQTDALTLDRCLQQQRHAFLRDGMPSLSQRKADLKQLRRAILAHKTAFEAALSADFGHRAPYETAIMELVSLTQGISYLIRNLRRFMRPEQRKIAMHFQPARAYVSYQPLGVVGIMSPWNYPMALSLMPLATALAAGNRVMLKPSEVSAACSELLKAMLERTFPPEQVAVFTGGVSLAAEFSALPFDHLLFTDSAQVGKSVMQAASKSLTPVTLELGGKSPVIIAPDHPLQHAAEGIAFGKLANAGQTCIAPDYVLVPEARADDFLQAYDAAVGRLYPQGPLSEQYTTIINEQHYARLLKLLQDARANGAQVHLVGVTPQDAAKRPHTLAPSVILSVNDDMAIMQQEIFGPLLPVVTYRQIDEAIAYVNARPRPLALYYFGANTQARRKVLENTTSGNVTVNATIMHYAQDDLPFGGVGPSGMGSYHGIEGFRSMSHAKGTLIQGKWNLGSLLRPPYGKIADLILKAMLR